MEKTRRTEVVTRDLLTELTDEEIISYARDMANSLYSIHELETELAKVKKNFKDGITTAQVVVDRLSKAIKTGQELRAIPCEIVLDFEKNERTVVRTDYETEIEHGPIPEADHQLEFGDREGVEDNPGEQINPMLRHRTPGDPQFEVAEIPSDATCMQCENNVVAGHALNREGLHAGFICRACADELEMEYDGSSAAFRLPEKED